MTQTTALPSQKTTNSSQITSWVSVSTQSEVSPRWTVFRTVLCLVSRYICVIHQHMITWPSWCIHHKSQINRSCHSQSHSGTWIKLTNPTCTVAHFESPAHSTWTHQEANPEGDWENLWLKSSSFLHIHSFPPDHFQHNCFIWMLMAFKHGILTCTS
jgi:hypothetical protein